MSDVLILALGNLLRGDDGVGPTVLEALRKSGALPESVSLLEGSAYRLLTALLAGAYRRVIIVDAVDMGGKPGEWARFTIDDVATDLDRAAPRVTLHNAGLTEVLTMGKALGLALPEMMIYGVQPMGTDWSMELSEPVQKTIPEVCEAILKLGCGDIWVDSDYSPDPRPEDNLERSECNG